MGNFKQTSVPDQMDSTSSVCSSPLIRTKFTGADSSIEYSTRPKESEEQNPETVCLEDRPSTPTILGYEVMEERAKFTVSINFCCTSVESEKLGLIVTYTCNFLNIKFKWFLQL